MGVREETLELLQQGHTPGEIAQIKGVNIKTTLAYLDQMVGEGRIRRSDILLSIPASCRVCPNNADERLVVYKYGQPDRLLGDAYEDVTYIEVTLHGLIRVALEEHYGEGEVGWWRQGVPENIRKSCQSRREEDEEPCEPFNYTDLIDLRQIMDKKWKVLGMAFLGKMSSDKTTFLHELLRLNRVRRTVMHPVRSSVPSEEDFDFLRKFRRQLESYVT